MFRRSLWCLPLLACACQLSFSAGGRPNRPTADSANAVAPAAAAALERGLSAIRAESLAADVEFLASDELEGRDTPSRGLRVAAEYLRARVRALGWEPGAGQRYFYSYDLTRKTLWSARTFGSAQKEDMRIVFQEGSDYLFSPRPFVDQEVTGEIVYAGGGSDTELEGLELQGRWVLCRDDEDVNWWRRRAAAREAGAAGVLVMPAAADGEDPPEPFAERFAGMLEHREGLVLEGDSEPAFPHVFLEQAAATRLLAFAGIPAPSAGRLLGVEFTEKRTFDGSGTVTVPNVCAFWPGTDEELAREVIVASAHYDHVGTSAEGEIYNGADDNASGSAALLALAEAIRDAGGLRRSVLLMWVSGEEKGLLGSAAWTRSPLLPEGCEVVCNLNVDMIARNAPGQVLMTPSRRHPEHNRLSRFVEANASLEGFDDLGSADAYWHRSDHANFSKHLAVPVVFLFTDVHEDYHQPTDTVEKLDFDKARRVTRLALRVLFDIDADD